MNRKNILLTTSAVTFGFIGSVSAAEYIVSEDTDDGTGLTPNTLSWAIFQANANPGADLITLTSNVTITGVMKRIIDSDLELTSDSIRRTINGNHAFRPLFIKSGQVTIKDIDITNGLAKGGDSGIGGAGAGLGGSLFVYDGNVTVSNVSIDNSKAVGGQSTGLLADGDHGGGMFGDSSNNDSGGLFGTPYGGYSNYRNKDPFFGGNGGGGDYGDNGGFGGGGTYGGYEDFGGYRGGFGGGGGAGFNGLGYNGQGGRGGFAAGDGSKRYISSYSPGGPGDGLGGAVFIRTGLVRLANLSITNNTAESLEGEGYGGGIYILSTLSNPGNSHGMPAALATISACGLTYDGNQASSTTNTADDNHDVYDVAQLINSHQLEPVTPCLTARGNGQIILNGDSTPNAADNTNFGSVDINDISGTNRTIEVFNASLQDITITELPTLTQSNNDFIITSQLNNNIISGGTSEQFTIEFNPSSVGLKTATVSFQYDYNGLIDYTFDIHGNAINQAPEIEIRGNGQTIFDGQTNTSVIDNTDFEIISLSVTPNHTFQIHNTGNQDLLLTGNPIIQISGPDSADFTVSSTPNTTSISANDFRAFEITFDPRNAGSKQATIEIMNSDNDENLYDFNVIGEALAPQIVVKSSGIEIANNDLTPSLEDNTKFHEHEVGGPGQSQRNYFTLHNTGSGELHINSNPEVFITGTNSTDFYVSPRSSWDPFTNPIPPGETEYFYIGFGPTEAGVKHALVNIHSSDPNDPVYQFAIEGTGFYHTRLQSDGHEVTEGESFVFTISLLEFPGTTVAPFDVEFSYQLTGVGGANATDIDIDITGTFLIQEGQETGTLTIPTLSDDLIEATEVFNLSITSNNPFVHTQHQSSIPISIIDSGTGDIYFKDGFE